MGNSDPKSTSSQETIGGEFGGIDSYSMKLIKRH